MQKLVLVAMLAFCVGYTVENGVDSIIAVANADVAGMSRYDLRHDRDFRYAVEDVVEDCEVDDDEIDC